MSATFRIGLSATSGGPWSWGSYDAAATNATASDYFKIELESLSGVDTIACSISSADEVQLAAGVPTVTVEPATRTATGRLASTVGATYIVRVVTNPGSSDSETKELAIEVKTAAGLWLLALDEEDQHNRTYYWLQKFNELARVAGTGTASATTSLTTRVSTEECTRASVVTSLTSRVSTEECTRASGTTSLTSRVSTEEAARAAADLSLETEARSGWVELVAATDYGATPPGALTLTMITDQRANIRPGDPVRWVSSVGVLTNNTVPV